MADLFPDTDDPMGEFRRFIMRVEAACRSLGFRIETFAWNWGKLFFVIQLGAASVYFYLCWHIPPTGYAIAMLGVVAAIVTFRKEPRKPEKAIWILIIFGFLVLELLAIKSEHIKQEAIFGLIISQGTQNAQTASRIENRLATHEQVQKIVRVETLAKSPPSTEALISLVTKESESLRYFCGDWQGAEKDLQLRLWEIEHPVNPVPDPESKGVADSLRSQITQLNKDYRVQIAHLILDTTSLQELLVARLAKDKQTVGDANEKKELQRVWQYDLKNINEPWECPVGTMNRFADYLDILARRM